MSIFDFFKKTNKDEVVDFTLEDVVLRHQADPRYFLIPSPEEIANVQVGDLVRLFFLLDRAWEDSPRAERMWVEVSEIKNQKFKGFLTNQPQFITTVQIADEISFSTEHIASILTDPPAYDTQKLAIVTADCLRRQEINWAIRNEELHHELDSGWQFWTGFETPEEQEDASTAKLLTIEEVLNIEPLLETVLDQTGKAYYYESDLNQFVEDVR